jgi:RNA polymerase sigma-70 factor (ECF subfamily)
MQAFIGRRSELRRLFLARTRSEADADDLVQDLFMKVAALDQARVDNPPAYLYRLALNLLTDERRRQARVLRRDSAWQRVSLDIVGAQIRSRDPSQEEQLGHRQSLALLAAAIEGLPPRTREVFRLHKLDGLTYAEVAARLGISRSGVEKQMMRALRHLLAVAPEDWT